MSVNELAAAELIERAMQALRAGTPTQAVAVIEAAPSAQRNTQAVQRTLAAAHAQNGDLLAAESAIQRALNDVPAQVIEPATRALAGRIALDLKQPANAFGHFEALVQIAPQQMAFWRYLWDAATTAQAARRALQLTQSQQLDVSADVRVAWAVTRALIEEARVSDALTLAEATGRRHPDASAAHWLWVKRLTDQSPLSALAELRRLAVPTLGTLDADAVDAALALPELYADDALVSAWRERYRAGLQALAGAVSATTPVLGARAALVRHTAFRLAYHGRDDLPLQRIRGDLMCALMLPLTPTPTPTLTPTPRTVAPTEARRIRVGFASKHIRDCTVGQYFKHFLTDLRDERISVFIYACGERDAFTDEVQQRVDRLTHFDDDDAARAAMATTMADDALDVLIYPEIGMEPIIEKLAAMRLAPLQCALWGHPVTTGLASIDVFLSAAALEPTMPDVAQAHYRERLHLLPGLGTRYPTPPSASTLSRAALGLPTSGALIVCAQPPFKWNPQFTRAVAEILRQTPDARLLLFDGPAAATAGRARVFDHYLQHFFAPIGIDTATRIIGLPQRARADFLAALAACDVALDSFGFSGGNSSLDALSVGVPVVTLPGEFMRGRQTFAMLKTLQSAACDALIAKDCAQYVELAVRLLREPATRAAVRQAITENVHKLFNDPLPVAALRAWLLGEPQATQPVK